MTKLTCWGLAAFVLLGLSIPHAEAQVCLPPAALTKTQAAVKYLRRLSLDLMGRAPTYAELSAVVSRGYVDDATVDGMLDSSQFVNEMREYHKNLLTLNITDLRFQGGSRVSRYLKVNADGETPKAGDTSYIVIDLSTNAQQVVRRGAQVACINEAAKYDAQKRMLCKVQGTNTYVSCMQAYYDRTQGKKIIAQEGYVMVQPYWESDPTKKVRVCGMAAQTDATANYEYTDKNGKDQSLAYTCSAAQSVHISGRKFHPVACGCGPRLEWCFRGGEGASGEGYRSMNLEVLESLMEQTMRFIDTITAKDRPYTDIILAKDAEYNGHISHFINKNTAAYTSLAMPSSLEIKIPVQPYYQKDNWKPYTRTSRDAGVLTLPFYTLKYATNRGRLHRFYNAFLCKHFTPPAGGLPDPSDKCHDEPNLMQRCGCSHCHTTVEPGAAHWGRWQENAWFPILDAAYKDIDPLCQGTTASSYPHCKALYLFAPKHAKEQPFKGHLLANVFATAAMKNSVKQGPAALAQVHINSGEIAQCSVEKMFTWFVGQDLQKDQATLKNTLAQTFQNSNYNVKKLVRAIVTSKEYRRGYTSNAP